MFAGRRIYKPRHHCIAMMFCILLLLCVGVFAAGEKTLDEARAALADGVYGFAQKQFQKYLSRYGAKIEPGLYQEVVEGILRSLHEQKKIKELEDFLGSVDERRMEDAGAVVFWKALGSYDAGLYAETVKLLDGFGERYPKSGYSGRVDRLRAWCYLHGGDIEKALAAFEEFDAGHRDSPEAEDNLVEWAKALMTAGHEEKAAEVLNRLIRSKKNSKAVDEGRLWLGKLYLKRANYQQAMSMLDTLVKNEEASHDLRAEAWYSIAAVYEAETNRVETINAVSNGISLAISPGIKRKGKLHLGRACIRMSRDGMGKLIKGGEALVDQGVLLLKEFVTEAPENPMSSEVQLELADTMLDMGMFEQAVDEFQHYIEAFTDAEGVARAHFGRGWALIHIERFSEAAMSFSKAYEMFGDGERKARAIFKAGDAHFLNGQFKLAGEQYRKLLKEYPGSGLAVEARFQLGESYVRDGEYELADKMFAEIVKQFPKGALAEEALLRQAEIQEQQGLLPEALDIYSILMSNYPKSRFVPEALFGRGQIYFRQWRFNQALDDFERAVQEYPDSKVVEEAYYKRGMCYYWLGQDDTALNVYQNFINRYPESEWSAAVMFWMGKYYFNHGDYKQAEKVFLDFQKKYGKDSLADDALLWAGHSLGRQREYVKAIETFARMVKEYPDSDKMAEARFAQGDCLCEIANFGDAILIFDEIINKYPDSLLVIPAWLRKGDCQFTLGVDDPKRYEESMGSYRVVVNSSDTRPEQVLQAEYKLGRCLEKMGRTVEAFEYYYQKVILRSLEEREKGVWLNDSARRWFADAAFAAAKIAEAREDFKAAVSILEYVVQVGAATAVDARRTIERIKSEHWWLFY